MEEAVSSRDIVLVSGGNTLFAVDDIHTHIHTYIHTYIHIHTYIQPYEEMEEAVSSSDIVLVSGGNTLFAVDRWRYLKLDSLLNKALSNGTVLAGGSAGAIFVFDGGHSDSADPESFKNALLGRVMVSMRVRMDVCMYV